MQDLPDKQLAELWIAMELDNWAYEADCAAHFHCRRVTERIYIDYLKFRFPDIFRLAGEL